MLSITNIKNKMILAPLAGVSDGTYRYLCHKNGAELSFTEMVSAKGLYYNSPGTKELYQIEEKEGNVGIQLFGSEEDIVAWAIKKLADENNICFDINMGCPVPKVFKSGEGSAMLLDEEHAKRFVEACVKASEETSKKPITVKMRLVSRPGEANKKPSEVSPCDLEASIHFAKALEDAGAQMITVHGRTREQYYAGSADWDAIKEIKKALSIPVVGNGDIRSGEDAKEKLDGYGVDLVMIGRGSMGNPWVFSGEKPSAEVLRDTMREHFDLLLQHKGKRAVLEMRKYFAWYTKGRNGAADLRALVNTAKTENEIFDLINKVK